MTLWTPGPWHPVLGEDQPSPMYSGLICLIQASPQGQISVVTGEHGSKAGHQASPEEWEANAWLIAASPDLYARLEASTQALMTERDMLYESFEDSNGNVTDPADGEVLAELDAIINANLTALAKARGEQP